MKRISTPTSVNNKFVPGNRVTGRRATQLSAEFLNQVQEEICALIKKWTGSEPTGTSDHELADAFANLALFSMVTKHGKMSLTPSDIKFEYTDNQGAPVANRSVTLSYANSLEIAKDDASASFSPNGMSVDNGVSLFRVYQKDGHLAIEAKDSKTSSSSRNFAIETETGKMEFGFTQTSSSGRSSEGFSFDAHKFMSYKDSVSSSTGQRYRILVNQWMNFDSGINDYVVEGLAGCVAVYTHTNNQSTHTVKEIVVGNGMVRFYEGDDSGLTLVKTLNKNCFDEVVVGTDYPDSGLLTLPNPSEYSEGTVYRFYCAKGGVLASNLSPSYAGVLAYGNADATKPDYGVLKGVVEFMKLGNSWQPKSNAVKLIYQS